MAAAVAGLAIACGGDSSGGHATPLSASTAVATEEKTTPRPVPATSTATATARATTPPPTRTQSPTGTSTPTTLNEQQAGVALARAIEAKDYAAIGAFMAPTVHLTIEATGCCLPGTPAEAVGNLSWLSQGAAPWSSDQSHPRVVSIKTRYASTYGGSLMIYSSDGIIAAFWFNESSLIDRIRLANGRIFGP